MKRATLGGAMVWFICLAAALPGSVMAQGFTEVAQQVGIGDAGSVADAFWYDCDGDRDLDMLETRRFGEAMVLYVNHGGQFSIQNANGLPQSGDGQKSIPMDFDADGDLDIFACAYGSYARLLVNEDGYFTDRTAEYGLMVSTGVRDMAWLDLEHDGWLDLLLGHYQSGWRLYHNDGGTHFTDITESSQLPATDFHRFCEGDVNLDGNEDLFLARLSGSEKFYLNMGNGVFSDQTVAAGLSGVSSRGGGEFADFDKDKYPDLLVEDAVANIHTIYRNNRDGTFSEMIVHGTGTDFLDQGYPHAVQYAVADYDMDGDLDFYVARQGSDADSPNQLFRMDSLRGNQVWFTDVAMEYGLGIMLDNYAVWGDYDGDGDLDLFVTVLNGANRLYRNDLNGPGALNNRLEVEVRGAQGSRDSWHTRIEVYPHGGAVPLASAEISQANVACNGLNGYFVLDGNMAYDLCLYFQDGTYMCAEDFPQLSGVVPSAADHLLTVYAGMQVGAAAPPVHPWEFALDGAYPNPFNSAATIAYRIPETSDVRLAVFTTDGRRVADLVNGTVSAGEHRVTWNAADQPSGVYFVRLTAAGTSRATSKIVLLK